MNANGIRPSMMPIGPVRVRLLGVVKGDSEGRETASVNAPNAAEAVAALNRVAQVSGAEGVINVASDYRRAAIAAGPLQSLWRIEVQAWGMAVATVEEDAAPEAEEREGD
ncbi:hypothetical protein IAG41_02430 [Sphingomonas sp. JC676]|uniref:hypothetical protein n=1 Tax=Sphingomonas sp. JC676 TaxID=2768065 RepID=UPI001657DE86|nr:hypothetical protein [Sphingomonas sp. JC676]MBC9031237.1 hypothetical protein [Sphingomonas sp. JC676]